MRRSQIEHGNPKRTCYTQASYSRLKLTDQFYRETASAILNEYLASVGGKELILRAWGEKKAQAAAKKGKKRGRPSTGIPKEANGTKKSRKTSAHISESPPASAKPFQPPAGNWEEEVIAIDACEGNDKGVIVYLTWKSGHRSQHPLSQVYKRCPQKVIGLTPTCLYYANQLRCSNFMKVICM